jgi:hypothetical protein
MADAQEIFDALSEPFPLEYIEWRVGSTSSDKSKGLALCYVDARAVMDRLDAVCGPAGWQCNYSHQTPAVVICNLGILIGDDWVWKADGAGATDVEGEKGMLSDALKRAAVRWGVGRYLYDLKSPWVELEPAGRSVRIKDSERKRLDDIHEGFASSAGWGLRAGVQAYKLLNNSIDLFVHTANQRDEFLEKNKGMIPQLPVAMRKHLMAKLDRLFPHKEAAE